MSENTNSTKGALQKRSMRIAGHRTSLALEEEFWSVLGKIAKKQGISLPQLIAVIKVLRPKQPLASAARVYALLNRD